MVELCGALPGAGARFMFDECYGGGLQGVFIKDGRIIFQPSGNTTDICSQNLERKLLVRHNLLNILVCLTVLEVMGARNMDRSLKAVSEFKSLEHRMELVGEFSGICFYDDSISTIPQAAICVVKADGVDTLIIGVLDRGIDYSELIDFIGAGRVRHIICLPATGYMIHKRVDELYTEKNFSIVDVDDMQFRRSGGV